MRTPRHKRIPPPRLPPKILQLINQYMIYTKEHGYDLTECPSEVIVEELLDAGIRSGIMTDLKEEKKLLKVACDEWRRMFYNINWERQRKAK